MHIVQFISSWVFKVIPITCIKQINQTPCLCINVLGNIFWCSFEDDTDEEDCPASPVLPVSPNAFNWTVQSGPTPSFRTGPFYAFHGENYMYVEASEPRRAGDFAE